MNAVAVAVSRLSSVLHRQSVVDDRGGDLLSTTVSTKKLSRFVDLWAFVAPISAIDLLEDLTPAYP
jgi:hypothetical protein